MFVVVVSAATTALAQDTAPESRAAASRPFVAADFSAAGMAQRIEHFRPALEAELGSSLGGPVIVHPVDRETLGRVIVEELAYLRDGMRGMARGRALQSYFAPNCATVGRTTFAKVNVVDGGIQVATRNFSALRANPDMYSFAGSQELLDGILVREAVHVWELRAGHLIRMYGRPRSNDEFQCRSAAVEGHAQFIARRVFERAGSGREMDLVARAEHALAASEPGHDRDWLDRAMRILVENRIAALREGEPFIARAMEQLGATVTMRRVLSQPPTCRVELADPERWLRGAPPTFDPYVVAQAVRAVLQEHDCAVATWGLPVASLSATLEPARADLQPIWRGLAGMTAVRVAPAVEQLDDPRQASEVDAVRLDSEQTAARLFDIWVRAYRAEAATRRLRPGDETQVDEVAEMPLRGGRAVAALWVVRTERGRTLRKRWLLAQRGPWVVAVMEPCSDGVAEDLFVLADRILTAVEQCTTEFEAAPESAPATEADLITCRGHLNYGGGQGPVPEFQIRLWVGAPDFRVLTIPGREGAFEGTVSRGRNVVVGAIMADGETRLDCMGHHRVSGSSEALDLQLPSRDLVAVRVTAAENGALLPDAEWRGAPPAVWRNDIVMATGAVDDSSPIRVGRDGVAQVDRNRVKDAIITAPGRASAHINLSNAPSGGVVQVVLKPGGDLHVVVQNYEALFDPRIDLWRSGGVGEFGYVDVGRFLGRESTPLEPDGTVLIPGLPPGRYEAGVRCGYAKEQPGAHANATVRAGAVTEVVLAPVISAKTGDVRLSFSTPTSWDLPMEVVLRVISRPADELVTTQTLGFSKAAPWAETVMTGLLPGAYRLDIDKFSWSREITVTGAGLIEVALPDLVRLSVSAVDAETGKKVAIEGVARRRIGRERFRGVEWDVGWAAPDDVQAVPGTYDIEVTAGGHQSAVSRVELTAGVENRVTVRLPPCGKVDVRVEDERGLPVVGAKMTMMDQWQTSSESGEASFDRLPAGRFSLAVTVAPGHELPARTFVEVKLHETAHLTLTLKVKAK